MRSILVTVGQVVFALFLYAVGVEEQRGATQRTLDAVAEVLT